MLDPVEALGHAREVPDDQVARCVTRELELALDDGVPEPSQELDGGVDCSARLIGEAGGHRELGERLPRDRDPERARLGRQRVREPFGVGLGGGVEEERCVGHGPRDRSVHGQAVPVRGSVPDPTALRLEAEDAGEAGRRPDGSQTVGAEGESAQPGGNGDGRPPARPARAVPGVPWVAGGAPRRRLGEGPGGELGARRLPDDDGSRPAERGDDRGVGSGDNRVAAGAPGRDFAGDIDGVLDRDRDTEQRLELPAATSASARSASSRAGSVRTTR